jgi:hypothetical protein
MPERWGGFAQGIVNREPRIRDTGARDRLWAELEGAIVALKNLEADPIVIAASPNRFNDIYWSAWLAVRFGPFFTERHEYARVDYHGDLRKGPAGARLAGEILARLEKAGWQNLFAQAFDVEWGDCVLALVRQDSVFWLVFSSSNASDANHVFALWDTTPIRYFGECIERFDQAMEEDPPLDFQIAGRDVVDES